MPITLPTHPWHLIRGVHLFIFAVGLRKRENRYAYDSILYAKVNRCGVGSSEGAKDESSGEIAGEMEHLIPILENLYVPSRSFSTLQFGVLGLEQFHFFESVWSRNLFADIVHPLLFDIRPERMIDANGFDYSENEIIYFAAERIKMLLDILNMPPENTFPETFNDFMIPERKSEGDVLKKPVNDIDFLKKIFRVHVLLHAKRLRPPSPDPSGSKVECQSILWVPVCRHDSAREFESLEQLKSHLTTGKRDDSIGSTRKEKDRCPDGLNIAVLGADQFQFFEKGLKNSVMGEVKTFIDFSYRISDDIDYICRNEKHASYHARRIEVLKAVLNHLLFGAIKSPLDE